MKKKPYLVKYEKWMREGELPDNGLCNSIDFLSQEKKIFRLFVPTEKDLLELEAEGKSGIYWGSDGILNSEYVLTPLRQTIVLLCAAVNDEL